MAIPNGIVRRVSRGVAFRPPIDEAYEPLRQSVLGGIAIGEGAAGREVQRWSVWYDGGSIQVGPASGGVAFTRAVGGVTSVSLAFDANMQVAIAYTTAAGAHLYYFDASLAAFRTLDVAGATSCRAAVDDLRLFASGASDVIYAYMLGGSLYYRQQREHYALAHLVGAVPGELIRLGQSVDYRLQFQVRPGGGS